MASRPRRAWVLPLAVLPLVACKPKAESKGPERDVRSWTLAEIEAELAYNDQVLAGEGIMVAAATPPVTAGVTPTHSEPAEPATEEGPPLTVEEPGEDDGQGETAPEPEPPQTGPAPVAMPETTAATQAEMVVDAPSERRANRRRMSARRDVDTRCERVCGLAEATCDLEVQICELATRHPDEPRYAQACLRAEQQCKAASEACQRCED